MKIFIIYTSAGSGHKKVAEAIFEEATARYSKESVTLLDLLDYTPSFFKVLYAKGYIFLISRMKWCWGMLFYLFDTKYLSFFNTNLRCFSNARFCSRFLMFLEQEKPDVIISAHFLVNELISFLKGTGRTQAKILSVITDFGVHSFWIARNIDIYAVACNKTKEILTSKGIDEKKIKVCGIPTRKQFKRKMNKIELKQSFGLQNNTFTVLILTGGIGIGPIYEIVRLLNDEMNIIAICGSNERLCKRLESLDFKNLKVFGWTETIEEAMYVSDVAITKPGGSSVSECLIMGLPMIFFSVIPGQESFNANLIRELGMGYIATAPVTIKEKVLMLKNNPQVLEEVNRKITSFSMKDSALNVLNLINE